MWAQANTSQLWVLKNLELNRSYSRSRQNNGKGVINEKGRKENTLRTIEIKPEMTKIQTGYAVAITTPTQPDKKVGIFYHSLSLKVSKPKGLLINIANQVEEQYTTTESNCSTFSNSNTIELSKELLSIREIYSHIPVEKIKLLY